MFLKQEFPPISHYTVSDFIYVQVQLNNFH